jgi:V8-like Glu-specific endopeptidase
MLKKTLNAIKLSVKLTVAALAMMAFSLSATEIKKYLDKEMVKGFVYKVIYTKKSKTGPPYDGVGATAFLVQADSGKVYLLTNRHVCERDNSPDKAYISSVEDSKGKRHPFKIIDMSKDYDLCLAEAPQGKKGIRISDSVTVGETLFYVGFPRGQAATVSYGDLVGHQFMTITRGVVPESISKETCLSNKDTTLVQESYGQRVFNVCYMHHNAMVSTMFVYGGASGSPVLNKYHQLVGVIYAAPMDGGWGWAMPLSAIKEFLKGR